MLSLFVNLYVLHASIRCWPCSVLNSRETSTKMISGTSAAENAIFSARTANEGSRSVYLSTNLSWPLTTATRLFSARGWCTKKKVFFFVHQSNFSLIWFDLLLQEKREPYTRLGVKQCMLRLIARARARACVCVCVCVRVEVPGVVGELKAKWEKLGRTIGMVWTRTGVWQNVFLPSQLDP